MRNQTLLYATYELFGMTEIDETQKLANFVVCMW